MQKNNIEAVDLVYLWVDDKDENWIKKRDSFLNPELKSEAVACCRFRDNDELKMSLRSVEKHLPWINKIFVVTDGQIPRWLDTENPKIEVVFHEQFIPQEYLPTFNSNVIEAFLHKIPGLSEYFLYANDDVFLNENLAPDFFFNKKGQPIARLHNIVHKKNEKLNYYHSVIKKAQNLIEKKYGIKYNFEGHHCVDAYTKTLYADCVREFESEYKFFYGNRFRQKNDIQRVLVLLYGLANKKVQLKKVKKSRLHIPIGTKFFNMLVGRYFIDSCFLGINKDNISERFSWVKPKMFCLNDNVNATELNRIDASMFLYVLFPQKSCFEKDFYHIDNPYEITMGKISVVIPTILANSELLSNLIISLEKDISVCEIIVVNNSGKKLPEINSKKLKILDFGENLYVNKSWNIGVLQSRGEFFALINDDLILPDNFCSKVLPHLSLENGLYGFDKKFILDIDSPNVQKDNYEIFVQEAEKRKLNYGIIMYGHRDNYFVIPNDMKIYCGDDYLFIKNKINGKKNYVISGCKIRHCHQLSSSNPAFDEIKISDCKYYKTIQKDYKIPKLCRNHTRQILNKVFNIYNEYKNNKKTKYLTLFGMTFKLTK